MNESLIATLDDVNSIQKGFDDALTNVKVEAAIPAIYLSPEEAKEAVDVDVFSDKKQEILGIDNGVDIVKYIECLVPGNFTLSQGKTWGRVIKILIEYKYFKDSDNEKVQRPWSKFTECQKRVVKNFVEGFVNSTPASFLPDVSRFLHSVSKLFLNFVYSPSKSSGLNNPFSGRMKPTSGC